MYTIIEYVISPLFNMSNNLPLLGGTLLLSVPVVLCHMLLFYIMFEVGTPSLSLRKMFSYATHQILTNILAEVTRHADRDFYGVWWGSGDFREFCRNWNKPVNGFLNTYIYKELRSKDLGFSFSLAITFLVSAICHEIIMFTVCRSLSPYIFTTMMLLVPVLMLENSRLLPAPYLVTLFRYWILFFSVSMPKQYYF